MKRETNRYLLTVWFSSMILSGVTLRWEPDVFATYSAYFFAGTTFVVRPETGRDRTEIAIIYIIGLFIVPIFVFFRHME